MPSKAMLKFLLRKPIASFFTSYPPTIPFPRPLFYSSSSSSSSSPCDLANSILSCRTPMKALELFYGTSNHVDPLRNPHPYSATLHYLAWAKLFLKARCLMKCFIEQLLKFHEAYGACRFAFHALNRVEFSKFSSDDFGVDYRSV